MKINSISLKKCDLCFKIICVKYAGSLLEYIKGFV